MKMSIEFRLKQLRDEIDKNVNDVLTKWNAKKVFLEEPFDEDTKEACTVCFAMGDKRYLMYYYVNMDEAIFKCEKPSCCFPFRNFKYKNFVDRTKFRYERIDVEMRDTKPEQKYFTSPTKLERVDNMENFNFNWLDDSFNSEMELDDILNSSEQNTCDVKEIINEICNNAPIATTDSSAKCGNSFQSEKFLTSPAPRLSKCLKYIEYQSPPKQISPKRMEMKSPIIPIHQNPNFKIPHTPLESIPQKIVQKKQMKNRKVIKKKRFETKTDQKSLGLLEFLDVINSMEPTKLKEFELATPVLEERAEVLKTIENASKLENQLQEALLESNETSIVHDDPTTYKIEFLIENPNANTANPLISCRLDADQNSILPITQAVGHQDTSSMQQSSVTIQSDESETSNVQSTSQLEVSTGQPDSMAGPNFVKEQHQALDENETINAKPTKVDKLQKYKTKQWIAQRQIKRQRKLENRELRNKNNPLEMAVKKEPTKRKNINIEVEEMFLGFDTLEPFESIQLKDGDLYWLKSE